MTRRMLEICVDSAAGLAAAVAGGADRIELCSALALGGLTPTHSLMRAAADAPVPVYSMIRPRPGDFTFDAADIALMEADIADAAAAGLAGVVLGASHADGRLDAKCLRCLREQTAALGLGATLHRAFDLAPDLEAALETAIALGFERVLSSGGTANVMQGLDRLVDLHTRAAGRISIMPGSGVNLSTINGIAARLPVSEIHSSASESAPESAPESASGTSARLRAFNFDSAAPRRTSAAIVAGLKRSWQTPTQGRSPNMDTAG